MKVILLRDVAKIGRRYEVAEVPSGYALNKLIPQGMAESATPANLKRMEARASKIESERATDDATFAEALAKAKDATVTVTVDANEQGHMFQALKTDVIVEAFQKAGITISEPQIVLSEGIKEVGDHTIDLRSGDLHAEVTITLVAKK